MYASQSRADSDRCAPNHVDRIGRAFVHGGLDLRTAWAAVLGLGRTRVIA